VLGKGRRDLDFNERRAFFEAYGVMAGPASIVPLRDLLEARGLFRRKQSPEVRMCAALGLGKVGTPEARAVLEAAANDKDRQVRNAVTAALRGAPA
jgi:HEAT repeat protein